MAGATEHADPDAIVELVVKNPYTHRAFSCSVATRTTISEIKHVLEESYVGRPKPRNQRLVFFGKIHPDSASLASIFKGQDLSKPQTCHLIISGNSLNVNDPPDATRSSSPKRSESTPSPETPSPSLQEPGPAQEELPPGTAGLVEQLRRHRALFHQQLSGSGSTGGAGAGAGPPHVPVGVSGGIQGLGLEAQIALNHVAGSLGGLISYGVSGTSPSSAVGGGLGLGLRSDAPRGVAAEDLGQSSDVSDRPSGEPRRDLSIEEEIVKLEQAYEQLLRTLVLSQQFHAISNSLLLTPQPIWQGGHAGQQVNANVSPREVAEMHGNAGNGHRGPGEDPAVDGAERRVEGAGALGEGQGDGNNVRVVRRVYVINVRLILKLAFLLYLVGNDASYTKMVWFCGMALLYYLHEMGCFRSLLGTDFTVTGIAERIGQQRLLQIPPAGDEFDRFSTDAATVVKSFVLSLLPSWHVQPYAEEAQGEVTGAGPAE